MMMMMMMMMMMIVTTCENLGKDRVNQHRNPDSQSSASMKLKRHPDKRQTQSQTDPETVSVQ